MADQSISSSLAEQALRQGQAAARAGRPGAARRLLRESAHLAPDNEEVWLWRAAVAASPQETKHHLERVIALNPENKRALAGLTAVEKQLKSSQPDRAVAGTREAHEHVAISRPGKTAPISGEMASPGREQVESVVASAVRPAHPAEEARPTVSPPTAKVEDPERAPRVDLFRLFLIILTLTFIAGIILLLLLTTGIVPAMATWGDYASPAAITTPVIQPARQGIVAPHAAAKEQLALPVPMPTPSHAERLSVLLETLTLPWQRADWSRVLALVRQSRVRDDPLAQEKAFAAEMNWGLSLAGNGNLESALPHFEAALAVRPGDVRALGELDKAKNYLAGQQAMVQEDWPTAIRMLTRVLAVDADYVQVRQLLGESYWQQGRTVEQAGRLTEAATDYREALAANPNRQDVRKQLAHVTWLLTPPTPTPTVTPTPGPEKWIDVDLSEQRLRAYEGNKIVLNVLVSTGLSRTPTVQGTFHIWVKMLKTNMVGGDPALHNYYNLKNVPYVMYFYKDYGLHGTFWHNNFGHPMSHGCVNLRTTDAKWLFNWADPPMPKGKTTVYSTAQSPGTRVVVHP